MDFRELLDVHHVAWKAEGHEHCRRGWLQLDCPYCSPGWDHYRLGWNLNYKYFNCWSCGPHGAASTMVDLFGLSYVRVKELMKDLEVDDRDSRSANEKEAKPGKLVVPRGLVKLMPQHKRYLRKRGFDWREIVRIWKIKAIGMRPANLAWRLFIPIFLDDEMVSWTTRSISSDADIRYRAVDEDEEKVPHKSMLYGEQLVKNAIVVCEGPVSAWAVGPGAVATCGTSIKQSQVLRMARYTRRIICFDNEPSAQRRARRLCDNLAPFDGETINVRVGRTGDDPASCPERDLRRLRRLLRVK